jgi:hypothetical protein
VRPHGGKRVHSSAMRRHPHARIDVDGKAVERPQDCLRTLKNTMKGNRLTNLSTEIGSEPRRRLGGLGFVQPLSCQLDELISLRVVREGFEWHDEAVAGLADDVEALAF